MKFAISYEREWLRGRHEWQKCSQGCCLFAAVRPNIAELGRRQHICEWCVVTVCTVGSLLQYVLVVSVGGYCQCQGSRRACTLLEYACASHQFKSGRYTIRIQRLVAPTAEMPRHRSSHPSLRVQTNKKSISSRRPIDTLASMTYIRTCIQHKSLVDPTVIFSQ